MPASIGWPKQRLGPFLILLVTATTAHADFEGFGGWTVFTASGALGETGTPWRLNFDAQYRKPDFDLRADQVLLRPSIGYALNQDWSVSLGYAYFQTDRESGERIDEHRPWQQLAWTAYRSDNATVGLRWQLEQRDVELGNELGWTLRTQLKFVHKFERAERWWAYAFVEPFVGFNDTAWGAISGLQQNRTALGVGYRLHHRAEIEFGYLNQFINRSGSENAYSHLAVLNLKVKIP